MASTVRNTTLDFGTFSIPVAVKAFTRKDEVKFDRACKDGSPVKRLEINANTGKTLGDGDIVRGVRDGDVFRVIPESAIEKIDAQTKLDSLEILMYVPLDEVAMERVTGGYYLAPMKGQSPRALRLLLDAMKPVVGPRGKILRGARAGVFKLMPRSLQHLAIVYPKDDGLLISTLAWGEDSVQLAEATTTLAGMETDARHLEAARELIDLFTEPVEALDSLTDDARELRAELIAKAARGEAMPVSEAAEPKRASDDLMADLQTTIDNARRAKAAAV